MVLKRYGDHWGGAILGFSIYLITVIEIAYVMLQILGGNADYQVGLGSIIINAVMHNIASPYTALQSLLLGPFITGGLGLIIIPVFIALTNTLVGIYTYKLVIIRGLGPAYALPITLMAVLNPYVINSLVNPWQPQTLALALGVMLYYYVDVDSTVASLAVSALLSVLSPYTSILSIMIPLMHGAARKGLNESGYYALTLGVIAVVYYLIMHAVPISITPIITTQYLVNRLVEDLASTAFLQLAFLDTGVAAIASSLISSISTLVILPPMLVITVIEALVRLRERRLAWLVLVISIIMTLLLTAISPLWPILKGINVINYNWEPVSRGEAVIYDLVSLAPQGLVKTPPFASMASLLVKPGSKFIGSVVPLGPRNGTYAICGDYELVINGYEGITKVNGLSLTISAEDMRVNTSSYVINNGFLTILAGAYQRFINVSGYVINLPPGRYLVSTLLRVEGVTNYQNITEIRVISVKPSGGVLPVNSQSTVSFNVYLNASFLRYFIIYGVSYTTNEAQVTLKLIGNGTVIYVGNSTAPPITSGLSPHPITFVINEQVPGGNYEIEIAPNQPMIIYVSTAPGFTLNIVSSGFTYTYPNEAPGFAIIYLINATRPITKAAINASLIIMDEEAHVSINGSGDYVLNTTITTQQWVNASINVLIVSSTPALPFNITVGPLVVRSLEQRECPTPPMVHLALDPWGLIRYLLLWSPLPIALGALPWTRFGGAVRRFRRYFVILGLVLMLLFYVVWILGFLNIVPTLYNEAVLRVFGALFLVGLVMTVLFMAMGSTPH
ncbi:hypothetical protein [Vulcanisaeta thermophila]|uniref:hypothetical protein n=1 Tax=Vulcanisaeta thermophila TaxID=867917 RepID=UPI000852A521|nr:hypothetical protein [Vulcanisaeta thermophila]